LTDEELQEKENKHLVGSRDSGSRQWHRFQQANVFLNQDIDRNHLITIHLIFQIKTIIMASRFAEQDKDTEEKDVFLDEQEGKNKLKKLLQPKKIFTDQFITDFIRQLEKDDKKEKGQGNNDDNDETGELAGQRRMTRAHEKISKFSIVLAHKIAPIIKQYLSMKQDQLLDDFYPTVTIDPSPTEDMAE
jgi:hypothetical protein